MSGGACLNVGCMPSKAVIRTSRLYAKMPTGAQVPADIHANSTQTDASKNTADASATLAAAV